MHQDPVVDIIACKNTYLTFDVWHLVSSTGILMHSKDIGFLVFTIYKSKILIFYIRHMMGSSSLICILKRISSDVFT